MPDIKVDIKNTAGTGSKSKITSNGMSTPKEERKEAVDGLFQLVGLGCIITGQFADAGAIALHSPPISEEVAEMAEKDEKIAGALDTLLQVGPYAGLVAAVMPLALQLLCNHKVLLAEKVSGQGIVSPDILESQVKTDMAKKAMEVMRQQREAEEELAQMRKEFMASQNGQTSE